MRIAAERGIALQIADLLELQRLFADPTIDEIERDLRAAKGPVPSQALVPRRGSFSRDFLVVSVPTRATGCEALPRTSHLLI